MRRGWLAGRVTALEDLQRLINDYVTREREVIKMNRDGERQNRDNRIRKSYVENERERGES